MPANSANVYAMPILLDRMDHHESRKPAGVSKGQKTKKHSHPSDTDWCRLLLSFCSGRRVCATMRFVKWCFPGRPKIFVGLPSGTGFFVRRGRGGDSPAAIYVSIFVRGPAHAVHKNKLRNKCTTRATLVIVRGLAPIVFARCRMSCHRLLIGSYVF